MKKVFKYISVLLLTCVLLSLAGCGLRDPDYVMSEILSAKEAYEVCHPVIKAIDSVEGCAEFTVVLESEDEYKLFYELSGEDVKSKEIKFILVESSEQILIQNGFFDDFKIGDAAELKVSNYTYAKKEYFYISSIVYSENEYLSEDLGIENIVKYLGD